MKLKITLLFASILSLCWHSTSATSLGVGDLAITSANADGDDNFSFVLLTNISGTTTVYFTERGWNDDAANSGANSNWVAGTDGTITWTFTGSLTAGTEIQITNPGEANTVGTASQGTITESASFSVSGLSDALIAYTGTGIPNDGTEVTNFIWATAWNNDFIANNTNGQNSSLPTGLTNGTNAIDISSSGDNIQYDCSETTPVATLRTALADDSNYNINNSTTYLAPGCAYLATLSTTWNGAWSNGTPTTNTEAVITSNVAPGSFSCKDLSISSGFSLNTGTSNTVTITGNVTNNGNGFSGTGTISFLNNGNTSTLSGTAFSFEGVINVQSTTTLATAGLLTLTASSASSYGTLIGDGTITGNVSAQAYLDLSGSASNGRYYHLGSPFTNAILSDFNEAGSIMVSSSTQQGTAFQWDATNAEWDPAGNGSLAATATNGKGYAIYAGTNAFGTFLRSGAGTITLSGEVTTNDVTIALTYNNGQSGSVNFAGTGIENTEGWNLLANPYLAEFDWDTQDNNLPTNLEGAYYAYNGTNYQSYTNGAGSGNRYIAPYQAFFVQLDANNPGNFVFDEDARTSGQATELYKTTSSYIIDGIDLHITGADSDVYDDVFAGFEANSTTNYDSDWDARKLRNADHVPNLYITLGFDQYSICRVPYMSLQSFPLNLDYTVDGDDMVISADITQLKSFTLVELEDLKTGIRHNLTASDYTFKYDASFGSNRFILHFSQGTVGLEKETPLLDVFAYSYNSGIKLELGSIQNANVKLFSLSGQLLNKQENVNGTITLPIMKQGVYLIRVNTGTSERIFKVIR